MLQFIRAPNFWYVYVRRYQQICTLMADSLRELRTAVREWECWLTEPYRIIGKGNHNADKQTATKNVIEAPFWNDQ